MNFRMGRPDVKEEDWTSKRDRLPDPNSPADIREKFNRTGFISQEIVALMGCHTLGKAKFEVSGFEGRWTMNPYVWDNTYY